jgi:hypothetical protein
MKGANPAPPDFRPNLHEFARNCAVLRFIRNQNRTNVGPECQIALNRNRPLAVPATFWWLPH